MNIDRLLKEKKITKAELANRMGILAQNVNANLKNPSEDTIRNIARALGVSIAELFDESENITEPRADFVCPNCGAKYKLVRD